VNHFYQILPHIRGIVLDVDGVLTDNQILITENGEFLRTMNVRDGYAIKRAIHAGLKIGVITGGRSEGVVKRLNILHVSDVFTGCEIKLPVFRQLLSKWDLAAGQIAYMGDDIPDLECLKEAGLSCCPADSVPEALACATFISPLKGGQGCVRDLLEKIMKSQNLW
jgi:3-deoxy-D-manno-octulosonate 8-phosphate phosphatase (KDO 8-P phosphatase)